jgi:hypothetical protein
MDRCDDGHLLEWAMKKCAAVVLAFWVASGPAPRAIADEREQALAAIEKLGGKVEVDTDKPGKPVRLIYLRGERVTDRELTLLSAVPDVRRLDLRDAKITNEGLRLLGQMPQLKALYLWNTPVTDAGLAHLKGLKRLHLLNLSDTGVTDKGLGHVGRLTSLDMLRLGGTKVTDKGLAELKPLRDLGCSGSSERPSPTPAWSTWRGLPSSTHSTCPAHG